MECSWCKEKNTPINGYHYISNPEKFQETMKILCQQEFNLQIEEKYARKFDANLFTEQDEIEYLDKLLFGGH